VNDGFPVALPEATGKQSGAHGDNTMLVFFVEQPGLHRLAILAQWRDLVEKLHIAGQRAFYGYFFHPDSLMSSVGF
jgi:hypothetical protein